MAFTIYDASVPVFRQVLGNLSNLLVKAEAHAAEKGIAVSSLLDAQLAPDMFAFTRQLQIATDHAKGAGARLAGREVPRFEDSETTFAELQARIAKTADFLATLQPNEFDGAETRQISLKAGPRELSFAGQDYLLNFAMPNFYFHMTTAYAILRHNGVPIGKMDFMGA